MPFSRPLTPLRRGLLREDVYDQLRDAIVDGTLAPGQVLRDAEVASWLGVSRTPVREALLRLGTSGLVRATPGRSTVVATIEPGAVRDAQCVVASMHRLAVEVAVPRLSAEEVAAMRDANDRFAAALTAGDVDAALAADDELHAVPVRASGNDAVATVLEQFTPVVRRVERLRFASLAGRESIFLHARLVDLCAAGEVEAAAEVSFQTWQRLAPLIESLPKVGGAAPAPLADGSAHEMCPEFPGRR
ncbi:GntR family transcriptional regulator [Austwickia sp. TVS 96-490-7B]|uniref:GntR family transcriptional regulator n=1 Tax=Austwickia sp. TVS 96-490-7B TaxID=2830843 RepID=UPI001C56CED0|nr:GntR family transcriptional regulator [Austwickia sp. TVS 96-490-7B]